MPYVFTEGGALVDIGNGAPAGKVGIGTLSPGNKLTIESNAASDGIDINNVAADGDPVLRLQLSGTTVFAIGVDDTDDKFKIGTTAIDTNTRLTIDGSGYVGIGTSSPSKQLTIEGSAGEGLHINDTGTTSDPIVAFLISGTSKFMMGVDNSDSDKFKIGTTALETGTRLTIDSNGKVGIGTSSPLAVLHVKDPLGGSGEIIIENPASGGTAGNIRFYTQGVEQALISRDYDSDDLIIQHKVSNEDIVFKVNDGGITREVMRIRAQSSLVGIGTTPTIAKLHVSEASMGVRVFIDGNAGAQRLKLGSDATGKIYLGSETDTDLKIITNDTEKIRILSGGNMGIGITSPAEKLHIDGAIRIGTTVNAVAGNIRWTGLSFEGHDGANWVAFAGGGAGWTEAGGNVYRNTGNVGIATTSPTSKLDVRGAVTFNEGAGDFDFRVEGLTDINLLFTDASTNRIGVGTASPTEKLEVNGRIKDKTGYLAPVGAIFPYAGGSAPAGWLLCNGDDQNNASNYEDLFEVLLPNIAIWGLGPAVGTFTADASTDTLTRNSHALTNGTIVHVANSGGALPGGLATATKYFVINATTNTFQLSTTSGGSAIDITSNGSGDNSVYKKFKLPDFKRRVPAGAGGTGTGTLGNAVGNTGGAETHTLAVSEMPSHRHEFGKSSGGTGAEVLHADSVAHVGTQWTEYTGGGGAHNNIQPSLVVNYIIKT